MTTTKTWQVGELKITRVQEYDGPGMTLIVPETTADNLADLDWIGPFVDDNGDGTAAIQTFVIEDGDQRIVVDTCVGNDKQRSIEFWSNLQGPFLDDLTAAGFAPESIDTVICTHLHVDHVGWNTRLVDGKWVPTFPNARYLLARQEWEHRDEDEEGNPVIGDSVQPVFDAGLVDLVDSDHRVGNVALTPTPGHTPGHVAVTLSSAGERAVITGDLVHHPSQFAHPEWRPPVDADPDRAIETRQAFMAEHADTPTLVIGTHFAGPTAGRLVSDGDVYRFDV